MVSGYIELSARSSQYRELLCLLRTIKVLTARSVNTKLSTYFHNEFTMEEKPRLELFLSKNVVTGGEPAMYERMLNKQEKPTVADMAAYCGESAHLFAALNEWLIETCGTAQEVTFPYGNRYGWGIAHRIKKKLICNIFAERGAFTVMMRLSNLQFASAYDTVRKYAQEYIDHKYPCSDGGWIHYRVTCQEHLDDIEKLLAVKCGLS